MSRHGPESDRITLARLSGTATKHARAAELDEHAAIDELVAIATEQTRGVGPRLRADLLSEAAGALVGSHRYNPTTYWSAPRAARLLMAAGADEDQAKRHAADTAQRLAHIAGRGGIGQPT